MMRQVDPKPMMPESALHAHVAGRLHGNGYCVVEEFLEPEAVAALARECRDLEQRGMLAPAGIGRHGQRQVDPALRGDRTRWFEPPTLSAARSRYWTRVDALRQALNRNLLLGLDGFDAHYALYPPGTRYARHRDRFRDDDTRVLSSVLYLNPDWGGVDGGELRIYRDAEACERHVDVQPQGGTLVLFLSADFDHEVLPAARERLSIAGWFRRAALPVR
jgi:SM-20-related protein